MLLSLVCFILLVKLNVKCRIDRPLRDLTFLQAEIHHGHRVDLLHTHVLLHHHLLQPLILTGSHQNSHRLRSRVHRVVQRQVLLHPWHPQGKHEIVILNVAGAKAGVTSQKTVVKERSVRIIIDGGSCNNLAIMELVDKLSLPTRPHPHPYYIQWFNNSGKIKVTRSVRVHFSIDAYADYVDCDVVPMQACSLLLGRPWQFDRNVVHHGRTNQFTLVHMDKKVALLPMSPEQIMKDDHARASKPKQEKNKSENEIAAKEFEQQHKTNSKSSLVVSNEIKLTSPPLLATKVDISDLDVSHYVCYAFVCKEALFSFEELPPSLPPVVTDLLQEFIDVFPQDVTPGLPPIRGIEHQIDLIPGASLPNRAPSRTNPEETKEIQRQVQELLDKGYI